MMKTAFHRIRVHKSQKFTEVAESACQLIEAILKRGNHRKVIFFQTLCPGSSVVEQWTENPRVGSSILPLGTTKMKKYTKFSNRTLASVMVFHLNFMSIVKECVTGVTWPNRKRYDGEP